MTDTAPDVQQIDLDDVNLADPDFWFRDDVDECLRRLRAERPISWHEHRESGAGMWSVVRYRDIEEITRDFPLESFVNRYGVRPHHDPGRGLLQPGSDAMNNTDPPRHTALRKRVSPRFTPRMIAKMEESVRHGAREIVDRLPDSGRVDFVADVASPLPTEVLCDLLGVPEIDRPELLELSNLTLGDQDPTYGGTPEEGTKATQRIREYGQAIALERRKAPGDDLISQYARLDDEGNGLTDPQLGGMFALMIAAGFETTRSSISHGMLALDKFRDQRARWMADFAGLERTAAEEIIRWATPVRSMARVVSRDLTYQGVHMREGDKLTFWYASANRDETVISDPFLFDVGREPNPGISFGGGGGPHVCLGANLARREVWVFFQEFLSRFPNVRVAGEPQPLRSVFLNGIKSLPIELA